jgi:SPP1 family predicted phage head-tail adaptor
MSGPAIDPGMLDRRLTLEAPDETPDGAGGVVRSYQSVATLWASVEPISARGEVVAVQSGATVTHRIVIRYRADITTRYRLRDGARVYRIVTLRERGKRFLEIQAEERTA